MQPKQLIMLIIYNILISIVNFFIPVLSFFIPKLKERNDNLKKTLTTSLKLSKNKKTIWFHSASAGEFEQAKPLIELIKKNNINTQILCTFFSPSGYNVGKKYIYADAVCYLPVDTYWNTKKIINKFKPVAVVFVRYELWYNCLFMLQKNRIDTFLINATYPSILKKTKIFLPFYRSVFNLLSNIYTVSQADFELFNMLKIDATLNLSADTRNDRILEKVEEAKMDPIIQRDLFDDELILICGSVWDEDVDVIFNAIKNYDKLYKKIRLILVPHEPTEKHISYIKNKFPNNILLSQITEEKINQDKIMIVDSIGKLLKLYVIADLVYIGGGFGVGVHSITEPAGYGVPLVAGSNCYNSPDTIPLLTCGALVRVENALELKNWLVSMNDDSNRKKTGTAANCYIKNNTGSTKTIYNQLIQYL